MSDTDRALSASTSSHPVSQTRRHRSLVPVLSRCSAPDSQASAKWRALDQLQPRSKSSGILRAYRIHFHRLDLQRRIASILGAYDDLIEVNRRRIALLEEMARRLFEEWFVRFRFPGMKPRRWSKRRMAAARGLASSTLDRSRISDCRAPETGSALRIDRIVDIASCDAWRISERSSGTHVCRCAGSRARRNTVPRW